MEDYRAQDIAARLRLGSFSVAHVTGEKRPVVFLHVARAEVESLCQQLEGAVSLDDLLAEDVIQAAHAAYLHGDTQAALREAVRVAIAKRGR